MAFAPWLPIIEVAESKTPTQRKAKHETQRNLYRPSLERETQRQASSHPSSYSPGGAYPGGLEGTTWASRKTAHKNFALRGFIWRSIRSKLFISAQNRGAGIASLYYQQKPMGLTICGVVATAESFRQKRAKQFRAPANATNNSIYHSHVYFFSFSNFGAKG
jgi:hypothetical protein